METGDIAMNGWEILRIVMQSTAYGWSLGFLLEKENQKVSR